MEWNKYKKTIVLDIASSYTNQISFNESELQGWSCSSMNPSQFVAVKKIQTKDRHLMKLGKYQQSRCNYRGSPDSTVSLSTIPDIVLLKIVCTSYYEFHSEIRFFVSFCGKIYFKHLVLFLV